MRNYEFYMVGPEPVRGRTFAVGQAAVGDLRQPRTLMHTLDQYLKMHNIDVRYATHDPF